MKFCQDHWDRLRKAIEDHGMKDLIASDGETVAQQMAQEHQQGHSSPTTFEPLMAAHMAIVHNALEIIGKANPSSVAYMLQNDDEVPEDLVDRQRYPKAKEGATWPRCPLCYLGLGHELTCDGDPRCKLPMVDGYAFMIEAAADGQAKRWAELKAAETSA